MPYFPDPLGRGAAFTGLPQTPGQLRRRVTGGILAYRDGSVLDPRPGSVTHVPFGSTWPARTAFRIRLAEGESASGWDDADRVLTVSLPKAQTTQTA